MVGHAGTAISTAVGMARGDDLAGDGFHSETRPGGRRVVSLIGDASIVNGVAMEGLNNAGTLRRQFLVVLNDNGMSIAQPQGAVAAYFDRLRVSETYRRASARRRRRSRTCRAVRCWRTSRIDSARSRRTRWPRMPGSRSSDC